MNYFKGEFLEEKDFTDEQQYHRDMLRLHNKDLHTWGIADGLVVDFTAGEKKITVHEGMAVDADGTHIVLDTRKDIDLTGAPTATALYLTISYNETPGDQRTDTGITGFARIVEEPKIQYSNSQPSDPSRQLILSTVTLNSDQTIQKVDPSLRKRAGVVAGDLEVTSTAFVLPIAKTNWPKIKGIGTGGIEIDATAIQANSPTTSFSGALTVGGNVGIGTTSPQQNLSVNRAMNIDQANANNGTVNSALTFGSGSGEAIASKRTAGGNQFGLDFYTNSNNRMSITNGGNVGIGTTTPTEKLEIAGNLKIAAHGTFIDFGSDTRQMIDLWGGGAYGIGIQSWTHYFRSAGNFAWYVGGSHSDTELDPGVSGTAALIIKRGSGNIGIGTTNPENADSWNKVLDVLGSGNAKLSVRTAGIDARIIGT